MEKSAGRSKASSAVPDELAQRIIQLVELASLRRCYTLVDSLISVVRTHGVVLRRHTPAALRMCVSMIEHLVRQHAHAREARMHRTHSRFSHAQSQGDVRQRELEEIGALLRALVTGRAHWTPGGAVEAGELRDRAALQAVGVSPMDVVEGALEVAVQRCVDPLLLVLPALQPLVSERVQPDGRVSSFAAARALRRAAVALADMLRASHHLFGPHVVAAVTRCVSAVTSHARRPDAVASALRELVTQLPDRPENSVAVVWWWPLLRTSMTPMLPGHVHESLASLKAMLGNATALLDTVTKFLSKTPEFVQSFMASSMGRDDTAWWKALSTVAFHVEAPTSGPHPFPGIQFDPAYNDVSTGLRKKGTDAEWLEHAGKSASAGTDTFYSVYADSADADVGEQPFWRVLLLIAPEIIIKRALRGAKMSAKELERHADTLHAARAAWITQLLSHCDAVVKRIDAPEARRVLLQLVLKVEKTIPDFQDAAAPASAKRVARDEALADPAITAAAEADTQVETVTPHKPVPPPAAPRTTDRARATVHTNGAAVHTESARPQAARPATAAAPTAGTKRRADAMTQDGPQQPLQSTISPPVKKQVADLRDIAASGITVVTPYASPIPRFTSPKRVPATGPGTASPAAPALLVQHAMIASRRALSQIQDAGMESEMPFDDGDMDAGVIDVIDAANAQTQPVFEMEVMHRLPSSPLRSTAAAQRAAYASPSRPTLAAVRHLREREPAAVAPVEPMPQARAPASAPAPQPARVASPAMQPPAPHRFEMTAVCADGQDLTLPLPSDSVADRNAVEAKLYHSAAMRKTSVKEISVRKIMLRPRAEDAISPVRSPVSYSAARAIPVPPHVLAAALGTAQRQRAAPPPAPPPASPDDDLMVDSSLGGSAGRARSSRRASDGGVTRVTGGRWGQDEVDELVRLVQRQQPGKALRDFEFGGIRWASIVADSSLLRGRGRTNVDCKDKWRVLKRQWHMSNVFPDDS